MFKMHKLDDKNCLVLEEVDNLAPTDEEIVLYAKSIGIDPNEEPELLEIAREGVSARVPEGWRVLQNREGNIFYQQKSSGVCVWEHPLDSFYRQRVGKAKQNKLKDIGNTTTVDENSQQVLPPTPNKSETIYQPLPSPRLSNNIPAFKTPKPPPSHQPPSSTARPTTSDSPDQGVEGDNFPHVNSSPTGPIETPSNCATRRTTVLSESTDHNQTTHCGSAHRRNHSIGHTRPPPLSDNKENNDAVDDDGALADRFFRVLRVSSTNSTSVVRQRRLFEEAVDGLNSCLYSPPESPKVAISPNHQLTDQEDRDGGGGNFVEFDGNASLRFMLQEKQRLQDKLDYLKLTYKAYKLRLASIESNIKMFCSASALSPRLSLQHQEQQQQASSLRRMNNRSQSFRVVTPLSPTGSTSSLGSRSAASERTGRRHRTTTTSGNHQMHTLFEQPRRRPSVIGHNL